MKWWFIGKKKLEYYKGILIKADLGLHDQIANKLVQLLPAGSKILDFGCGEGALSQKLVDLGYDVVAADINYDDFKANQIEFKKINFNKREEVECFLHSHKNHFDAVLGIEVIEHVYNPYQYVDDLLIMLKQHGVLLITTPNITSWLSRFIFFFTGRFHQFSNEDVKYGHIAPISPWELNRIALDKELQNIVIEQAGTLTPVYINGINKLLVINLLALFLRPFMKGYLDGWCVMLIARKS